MTLVSLKEVLARRERLGISQAIEPSGVAAFAEEVLTYPLCPEGVREPSRRSIVILPPDAVSLSISDVSEGTGLLRQTWPLISCAALSDTLQLTDRIRQYSERTRTPVFASLYDATLLSSRLIALLGELGEQRIAVHGVLVRIGGVGVLITGESGIGKTACGVELVRRGAMWVADDVIVLQGRGAFLYGSGHKRIRRWIALRGKGLLRAESLLGKDALLAEVRVNCVMQLSRSVIESDWTYDGNGSNRLMAGVAVPRWLVLADDPRRTADRVIRIVNGFGNS